MKLTNKNKKTIIQIIIISAFAFFIVGNFFPILSFSHSDMLEAKGEASNQDFEWCDSVYLLFSYQYYRDDAISYFIDQPCEFHTYTFFYIYEIQDSQIDNSEEGRGIYKFLSQEIEGLKVGSYRYFFIIPLGVILIAAIYFGLNSMMHISKKYSKAPLYAGIFLMIPVIFVILLEIYAYTVVPTGKSGSWALYFKYHLGLLYFIISIILYFVGFFFQKNIDYEEKEMLQQKSVIESGG